MADASSSDAVPDDNKQTSDTVEQVPTHLRLAPQWIRDLSPEELDRRERALVRKIDLRL
jgi:hypothetical protein